MHELHPGEEVILGVSAERRIGLRKIEGRLHITSHRLHFQPLEEKDPAEVLSIPLDTIEEVKIGRLFKVIPNGLSITLKGGEQHKIITDNHDRVVKALRGQLTTRLFYMPETSDEEDDS